MRARGAGPALIIFDCDGVLIDSETIACRADAACLAEIGIGTSANEIMERYVGLSVPAMLADLEARHGRLPADFADTLRRRTVAAFETELRAMVGVEELLGAMAASICIASSSAPERLRHSLELVGLWGYFQPHVFSAMQVARGKPAPDLFLFAAHAMGADPAACLVIEDSIAGIQAAVAAGMTAIGFTGGSHCRADHAERLRAAGAVATAATMPALKALIAGAQ
ncbi:MAG TPA: HAD family hydrolase [Xanthobacteraceae bacterium]|nr:HAD family hydrolase [Xanthobacteraceae bacterium]